MRPRYYYDFEEVHTGSFGPCVPIWDPFNVTVSSSSDRGHVVAGHPDSSWISAFLRTPEALTEMRVGALFETDTYPSEGNYYFDLWARFQDQFSWEGYNMSVTRNGIEWLLKFWVVVDGSWIFLGESLS